MPSLVQAGDCFQQMATELNSGETMCVAIAENLLIYQHLFNPMSISTCWPDLVFTILNLLSSCKSPFVSLHIENLIPLYHLEIG